MVFQQQKFIELTPVTTVKTSDSDVTCESSQLWSWFLASWIPITIFLLLYPAVIYTVSPLLGVRANQYLLRFRSSALLEWFLLFITFALGTVFLVLYELRISSEVPNSFAQIASWGAQTHDDYVGLQQLFFPFFFQFVRHISSFWNFCVRIFVPCHFGFSFDVKIL